MAKATLERINPSEMNPENSFQKQILSIHCERYEFAAGFVRGKKVVDLACGVGYGSQMLFLKGGAEHVWGVDISDEAIGAARTEYQVTGLTFTVSPYQDFQLAEPVDVLVSLETIEHLPDPRDFLNHAARILRPGGELIASVPVTPSVDVNPYHLQDFTRRSFLRMLRGCGFRPVDQMLQVHRFRYRDVRTHLQKAEWRNDTRDSMAKYYLMNPGKALLRVKSLAIDGFANKYLVVRSILES